MSAHASPAHPHRRFTGLPTRRSDNSALRASSLAEATPSILGRRRQKTKFFAAPHTPRALLGPPAHRRWTAPRPAQLAYPVTPPRKPLRPARIPPASWRRRRTTPTPHAKCKSRTVGDTKCKPRTEIGPKWCVDLHYVFARLPDYAPEAPRYLSAPTLPVDITLPKSSSGSILAL